MCDEIHSFVNSWIFRIDGKYYDLKNFASRHPGGKNILKYSKQKSWDATQLFATHHLNYEKIYSMLNKFEITDSKVISHIHNLERTEIPKYFPKQIPHFDSKHYQMIFGETCDLRIEPEMKPCRVVDHPIPYSVNDLKMADCVFNLPKKGSFYYDLRSSVYSYFKANKMSYYPTGFYMFMFYVFAVLLVILQLSQYYFRSKCIAVLTGFVWVFLGGYGHQFIHIPRYRHYAHIGLDWIGLYSHAYMRDHVVLHHIYTNTIPDNHFDGTDPFLYVSPFAYRAQWRHTFNWFLCTVTVMFGIFGNYFFNLSNILKGNEEFHWCLLLYPLNYAVMCALTDVQCGITLTLISTFFASHWYFTIALMNHNQSENWNLPEFKKASKGSWAELQLVTSTDIGYNYGYFKSMFSLWLNYHTLHHLIPTVDMSHHREAQKILSRVAKKHNLKYHYKSPWTMYWDMMGTFSVARAFDVMLDM